MKYILSLFLLLSLHNTVSLDLSKVLQLPNDVKNIIFRCTILNNETKGLPDSFIEKLCIKTMAMSAAFNQKETRIRSASWDDIIRLWNTQTGRQLLRDTQTDQQLRQFTRHTNLVNSVIFNQDESKLLFAFWDRSMHLWDIQTDQELRQFIGHTDWVNSVIFNQDESKILSTSLDKTIRLWDTQTAQQLKEFIGHTASVTSAIFNRDESTVLSASADSTIRLWDAQTTQQLREFIGHTKEVRSAFFNHDESQILSASDDGTIRLWIDLKKSISLGLKKYNSRENQLVFNLFMYKKFLKKYHPKVDRITFGGLAKFLNQRENVEKVTEDELKDIYCGTPDPEDPTRIIGGMNKPLKEALYTIFYTHYKQIVDKEI